MTPKEQERRDAGGCCGCIVIVAATAIVFLVVWFTALEYIETLGKEAQQESTR